MKKRFFNYPKTSRLTVGSIQPFFSAFLGSILGLKRLGR